jgi:hypothetical protein
MYYFSDPRGIESQEEIHFFIQDRLMLYILNTLFFLFHSLWILLILFGWMHTRTLRISFCAVLLTALSWFGLGFWYGWGYCICTDWHWKVRREMGIYDRSNNYVHFLIVELTGVDIPSDIVNSIVMFSFLISAVLSVLIYLREYRGRR